MQRMNNPVKIRSLTTELRKNIQVGVALYSDKPIESAWRRPAKVFVYPGSLNQEKAFVIK